MFGLTHYNRRNNGLARKNNFWDLGNVFEDFFNGSFLPGFYSVGNPIKADIRETEKEYIIDAEMPGIKKEDIKLELRDDTLTIAVEQNEEVREDTENYIRRERRYGSFSRSFYVENIKQDEVTAKYDNGILTIKIPKDHNKKSKGNRIEIQ